MRCCGAAVPRSDRRRGTYCGWRSGLVVSSQEFGAAAVDRPKVTFTAASGCPSLSSLKRDLDDATAAV